MGRERASYILFSLHHSEVSTVPGRIGRGTLDGGVERGLPTLLFWTQEVFGWTLELFFGPWKDGRVERGLPRATRAMRFGSLPGSVFRV